MTGDTADTTATAATAWPPPQSRPQVNACYYGRQRRSPPFRAAFSLFPAVLNANVNANGKRTFAFVPSMKPNSKFPLLKTFSEMSRARCLARFLGFLVIWEVWEAKNMRDLAGI